MPDSLNKISEQITNFWKKFDRRQKMQMLVIALIVIILLVILTMVLSKPTYVPFVSGLEPKKTNEVKAVLEEKGIEYQVRNNATALYVESKKKQDAQMAVDSLGIISNAEMDWKEAFNNSLNTTQSEMKLKYQLAFENELSNKVATLQNVDKAIVKIVVPNQDRTIFDDAKESKASVILTTKSDLNSQQILGIANFVASAVENLELKNIRIIDNTGKILFLGENDDSATAGLTSQLDYELAREDEIRRKVISLLLARGEYNDAEAQVNLTINFDHLSSVTEKYSTPEGQTKGIPSSTYSYESKGSTSEPGGVPGTDTNDAIPDYPIDTNTDSNNETNIEKFDYEVNKTITNQTKHAGDIDFEQSAISVVVNKYKFYNQEVIEKQGLLEDNNWEAYKQNITSNKITVDDDIIALVKNATNISKVQIIGYEVPIFIDKEVKELPLMNYLPVAIILLLIALLAYAVYKGTEPVEVTEIEPELSVEDMLATTKERQELENIEFDDKSETRQHIEKFVDEKPDAVAQLLRNWLNENWE